MAVLFISDLHLDPARPDSINDFTNFCEHTARDADRLYILGDLFEAWIGDDDDNPGLAPILHALTSVTRSGTQCFFQHGNRDFLVGKTFAHDTGVQLLGDFERIDLFGDTVLITHGDLLCTDDHRYLELRSQLRNPAWQDEFLGKPLPERRRIAAELRAMSQTEMSGKSEDIMDVNQDTVTDTMRRHQTRLLVHGHTHRPAVHHFDLDGKTASRIVLSDWYGEGGYLRWDESGRSLEPLAIP